MKVLRCLVVLVTQSIGAKHSGRRAHNALQLVYKSLQDYCQSTQLESEMGWRRTMTTALFSQWYKHSNLDYADFWLYKITRILARINSTTSYGVPCRGRQKDRIRLCQDGELLCHTILTQLHKVSSVRTAADATYTRKLILSYPVW